MSRALSALSRLPTDDPARLRVERVAESFVRDGRRRRKKEERLRRAAPDVAVLASAATGAVGRREDAALTVAGGVSSTSSPASSPASSPSGASFSNGPSSPSPSSGDADPVGTLLRPRRCYVCKQHFTEVSAFYHQLCPSCAAENLAWRSARTPLDGRRALVTGGRVKIGFQVALMLLRDGAAVRVVTRFPHDAVRRFRQVEDGAKWLDRVNVTAVEGRFEVRNKTAGHPHTNMAKAALNMLTRTSAEALARRGIYLSSVDTGWITDEKPMPSKTRHAETGLHSVSGVEARTADELAPVLD